MTKTNKINVILIAVLVIAIIATAAEILTSIKNATVIDWLPMSAVFSALAVAFSCNTKNKEK